MWQSVLCVVAASADFTEHTHIAQSASAWVKSSADFTEHTHTLRTHYRCLYTKRVEASRVRASHHVL